MSFAKLICACSLKFFQSGSALNLRNGLDDKTDLWQWLARVLFLLLGGVEATCGVVMPLRSSEFFDGNAIQTKVYLVISLFWAGGLISRLCFCFRYPSAYLVRFSAGIYVL